MTGVSFVEMMAARATDAIARGVGHDASRRGDAYAWRCLASASMAAGIAVAFADPDQLKADARSELGLLGATKRHQVSPAAQGKLKVRERWEEWEAGKDRHRLRSGAAFAREMVFVGLAKSTDVVERWVREWRRERQDERATLPAQ